MNHTDADGRPLKKRRFFADDSPVDSCSHSPTPPLENHDISSQPTPDLTSPVPIRTAPETKIAEDNDGLHGFDVSLFEAVVGGGVPSSVLKKLKQLSNNDVTRAVNLYLDGSWNTPQENIPAVSSDPPPPSAPRANGNSRPSISEAFGANMTTSGPNGESLLTQTPYKRYIGAFGAVGWATKSGTGLLRHEEKVGIERAKMQVPTARLGKRRVVNRKTQDLLVRFTNERGAEVGRLENESAAWMSPLIDQGVCSFEGSVVYVPERMRTGETIYLQLRCYLLNGAFQKKPFSKLDNRTTTLFEEQENEEERDLRLRQVALVKLFEAINLQPSRVNETTEKHKRQGLLQAAEVAEQYELASKSQNGNAAGSRGSSPPSEEEEEGKELEQDQLDTLYKKAQSFDFNTPEAEPADTFALDLRKYQRQALHWMMGKEKDQKQEHKEVSMHPLWEEYHWPTKDVEGADLPQIQDQSQFYVNPYSGELSLEFPKQEQNCLGGILADEMGLGKTIEMLSLIHTHKNEPSEFPSTRPPKVFRTDPAALTPAPYTTLVVGPMSLLAQWASEAEKASKTGAMKTLVYYGNEKSINLPKLCCESNAANAPNLIITSYGVVLSEFNQVANMSGQRGLHGGLFSLDYFRVILDEAHYIKNRQSKTAKACYEIAAKHRWVLTGTPIVNRLEDLFSLVRFLKVEPWSNFSFWKTFITVPFESKEFIRALDVVQTVLEPLVLRRTKDMKTPDGEALVPLPPRTIEIEKIELSQEERDVYDHIFLRAREVFNDNAERGTLLKQYTTIFAQILRLRQSCCSPLLTRNKTIVADEEDAALAADLEKGLADDMDLQSLIDKFTSDADQDVVSKYGVNVLKQIQEEAESECPICSEEPMIEQAVSGCWHSACKQCLLDYINHQREKGVQPRCFSCREPINARDIFEVVRHDHVPFESVVNGHAADDNIRSDAAPEDHHNTPPSSSQTPHISLRRIGLSGSAKTQALLTHLKQIRKTDPSTKSVVFSQFTAFMDLLQPALSRDRIPFLRFDGTLSQKARAAVLDEFTHSHKPYVLLLSLRAGGVGLNLTCAKRVFMMDPWWSFAVEAQAIDRVHRMGQVSEVKVVRFIVEKSIEEKMIRIQERKKVIASSLGMMNDEEKRVQRIEDIKELLS